jgi:hypothetical protein
VSKLGIYKTAQATAITKEEMQTEQEEKKEGHMKNSLENEHCVTPHPCVTKMVTSQQKFYILGHKLQQWNMVTSTGPADKATTQFIIY